MINNNNRKEQDEADTYNSAKNPKPALTLIFDLLTSKLVDFKDSWWNISTSSLATYLQRFLTKNRLTDKCTNRPTLLSPTLTPELDSTVKVPHQLVNSSSKTHNSEN